MAEIIDQHAGGFSGRQVYSFSDTQADIDVSTTGQSNSFDVGHLNSVAITADLTELTGGSGPTVTFTFQDSPDDTNWYTVNAEDALSAIGAKTQRLTSFHRFVRVAWVTTGTPTTATASVILSGR